MMYSSVCFYSGGSLAGGLCGEEGGKGEEERGGMWILVLDERRRERRYGGSGITGAS